jgi:hypothetical protein
MQDLLLLSLAVGAAGHGAMTRPPPRNGLVDPPGCTMPNDSTHSVPDHQNSECYRHMRWFCGVAGTSPVDCATPPGLPSIPESMYSSPPGFVWSGGTPSEPCPGCMNIPWRSAGSSVPASACGVFELDPRQNGVKLNLTQRTVWKSGQIVTLGHSIAANHGGGYSWRLCPASTDLSDPHQAEDCFRRYPLPFADQSHTIQWSGNLTVRDSVKISASQTSSGTTPAGSTWRRHPIPSLEFCAVGPCDVSKCPAGWTQSPCPAFKPPCDGCWGGVVDAQGGAGNSHHEDFEVLDDVVIPTDWPAGDYTLQWRWDTESLPGYKQVWTNCADVTIKAPWGGSMVV